MEELRKMIQDGRDQFEKIFSEIGKVSLHLKEKEKESEKREKQLLHREAQNEAEGTKLNFGRRMKRMKYRNIIELEKKLDVEGTPVMEVEPMRVAFQVRKDMTEDDDMEGMKKMVAFERDLKEMKEALNEMEKLNKALIVRDGKRSGELQEARKLLIKSLRKGITGATATIGLKQMEGLDIKPFRTAMKRKFPGAAEAKAIELCSLWENYVKDSTCHPFKIIVDKKGNCKKILDGENETLKFLKNEYGEEAFNAVTTAFD